MVLVGLSLTIFSSDLSVKLSASFGITLSHLVLGFPNSGLIALLFVMMPWGINSLAVWSNYICAGVVFEVISLSFVLNAAELSWLSLFLIFSSKLAGQ